VDREEHFYKLEPGEFSGELNLLNHRETLIAARALAGSNILRVPRKRLREFLIAELEIGELVVRTIVQKRQWLVHRGAGGLVLGDDDGGDTARLTRFLSANSYPFRALNPKISSPARSLAEERGVQDSEQGIKKQDHQSAHHDQVHSASPKLYSRD
jgi:thioredoxin reductase (NADPH)